MTQSTGCFLADKFVPKNKPLLSKEQWQEVQLLVATLLQLPTKTGDMAVSDPTLLAIYKQLFGLAATFHAITLPQARGIANNLWDYGESAQVLLGVVAKKLGAAEPDVASITTLLGALQKKATHAQKQAAATFTSIQDFANGIQAQQKPLNDAVVAEKARLTGIDGDESARLADITIQHKIIDAAGKLIISDLNVIKQSAYYAWIWPIGTAVAIGEEVTHNKDIVKQDQKIKTALVAIAADREAIRSDAQAVALMGASIKTGKKTFDRISVALNDIQKLVGAWSLTATELGAVIDDLKTIDPKKIKDNVCMDQAQLAIAVNQWQDVANDMHNFLLNFYVQKGPD